VSDETPNRAPTTDFADEDVTTVLAMIEDVAKRHYGGHLTIMRFTTNWRVGFGTPDGREDIQHMCEGKTLREAAMAALVAGQASKEKTVVEPSLVDTYVEDIARQLGVVTLVSPASRV
jgi:hypothetical protein